MKLKLVMASLVIIAAVGVNGSAQQASGATGDSHEARAPLTSTTTAFDARGNTALEGRLLTTMLNGAQDSPVTNVRLTIKNASATYYSYLTGWATFYGSDGVRCGEGLFKVDALAPGESAETDTPGLRLRCSAATWRIVATNLLTRASDIMQADLSAVPPSVPLAEETPVAAANLVIAIDGEEHPIQLNNPLVVKLGNRQRRIVVRAAP
ncbi:MAG: hypothetical protein QOE77_2390 [Blastocatellia bacterium]|jgi:hypothetical protein|nr:hypothetical protein [Blastocatellia bacterium]